MPHHLAHRPPAIPLSLSLGVRRTAGAIQPTPTAPFTPRPLIFVQCARVSSLNSQVENITRAIEQKVVLVKRSFPLLPTSPRTESQIAYLKNGRPLVDQNPVVAEAEAADAASHAIVSIFSSSSSSLTLTTLIPCPAVRCPHHRSPPPRKTDARAATFTQDRFVIDDSILSCHLCPLLFRLISPTRFFSPTPLRYNLSIIHRGDLVNVQPYLCRRKSLAALGSTRVQLAQMRPSFLPLRQSVIKEER